MSTGVWLKNRPPPSIPSEGLPTGAAQSNHQSRDGIAGLEARLVCGYHDL